MGRWKKLSVKKYIHWRCIYFRNWSKLALKTIHSKWSELWQSEIVCHYQRRSLGKKTFYLEVNFYFYGTKPRKGSGQTRKSSGWPEPNLYPNLIMTFRVRPESNLKPEKPEIVCQFGFLTWIFRTIFRVDPNPTWTRTRTDIKFRVFQVSGWIRVEPEPDLKRSCFFNSGSGRVWSEHYMGRLVWGWHEILL
jgi:hypothetical protein